MKFLSLAFQCLSLLLFFCSEALKIPRLDPFHKTIISRKFRLNNLASSTRDDDQENRQKFYYSQTLDHFNYKPESYTKFQQKYLINFKYWGGANTSSPIFAYLGDESPLDFFPGFLSDNAAEFNALLVYMEHRFYGESKPCGSMEEAVKNASVRGYFNSAQALADYAEILLHIKQKYNAQYSPIIVFGGSYGGMLASWFRLKYPHVALGALASSAPILYFDGITPQDGYYSIVTKDFKEESETCYQTIKDSWSEIDKIASKPDGLAILSKKFMTCKPLNDSSELKEYFYDMYANAAQYNNPSVTKICKAIDNTIGDDDDNILSKLFAAVVSSQSNHTIKCYINPPKVLEEIDLGWPWQTCSEMVIPIGISRNNETMFPAEPFDLNTFIEQCNDHYGVTPRPHWVTTYYGGQDIKLILKRYGSDIIFSNGLKDPYSSGGVLKNISDTIVAIPTLNGSHCLDILKSEESDPKWLVMQRKTEVDIIKGWIAKYSVDLST